MIRLDGNYLPAALGERGRNYAGASADINHEITLLNIAVTNQKSGQFWAFQKVLAKLIFTHLLAVTLVGGQLRTWRRHWHSQH